MAAMSDYVPQTVYLLCALTSVVCTALMFRSYRQGRQRLVLLLGLCFAGLALNNILLAVDLVWVTSIDLSVARGAVALAATAAFLFALIWEAR
jgi:hypothetical protein